MFTAPSTPEREVTQNDVEKAAAVLGVSTAALSAECVKEAFRVKLREAHPDAGGSREDAADQIKALGAARTSLIRWLESAPDPKCACRGTGYVFGRFAVKPCTRCG